VYAFQCEIIKSVKQKHPHIDGLIYFSDGAASQYKNRKNFSNLINHKSDFNVNAEWHFFGTSHGKSPCDGVGGTVKRLATRASLQGAIITTPRELYDWGKSNVSNVEMIYVDKEQVDNAAKKLRLRFQSAKTIIGTRENHCFLPNSQGALHIQRISGPEGKPGFICGEKTVTKTYSIGDFVCVKYDLSWYIGVILDKDDTEGDAKIKFMSPCIPSSVFRWPEREDICYVEFANIMQRINVPAASPGGRTYIIDIADKNSIAKKLKQKL